jgi:isoleucyl-tRNA synthetase
LEGLSQDVVAAMDHYDLQRAVRPFVRFIENLTNWYIRRSRRRFWKSQDDEDKARAYATLYHVLVEFTKIAAPFIPFLSESLYRNLRTAGMPESVHLCDFPVGDPARRDPALEAQMDAVMRVASLGHAVRAAHDLKTRQPLARMHVIARDQALLDQVAELRDVLLEELNVKAADFAAHESAFATVQARADFSRLGPRLGARVKEAAAAIAALDSERVETLAGGGTVTIQAGGTPIEIRPDDVRITHVPHAGSVVAADAGIVVVLETGLTEALVREGLAREFVSKVQNMRKAADLQVTQRIALACWTDAAVRDAVERHQDYVLGETLCTECRFPADPAAEATAWDLNGHACAIRMRPA